MGSHPRRIKVIIDFDENFIAVRAFNSKYFAKNVFHIAFCLTTINSKYFKQQNSKNSRKLTFLEEFWQILFFSLLHQNKIKNKFQEHFQISHDQAHRTIRNLATAFEKMNIIYVVVVFSPIFRKAV